MQQDLPLLPTGLHQGWSASLELGYAVQFGCTVPVHRKHHGPLRVQKHYPNARGGCQHIIVHPPGGIAGGDQLAISVDLQPGCDVLITSPGAAKWYDSFGRTAGQQVYITLAPGSRLQWLPLESIIYAGGMVSMRNHVHLQGDATLLWGDVTCLGRPAANEAFDRGHWQQAMRIQRDDTLLWHEQSVLPGGSPALAAPTGMRGHTVMATLLWAGPALPEAIHQAALVASEPYLAAATQLPGLWLARYLGDSAEQAHHWLRCLWRELHPFTHQSEAIAPRIWST